MDDTVRRSILIGLLLTAQAGLIIYAGTTPGAIREGGLLGELPGVPEYDLLAADEIAVQADVVADEPVVGVIQTPTGAEQVRITGIEDEVSVGDRIRLRGERQADGSIRAKSVFVVSGGGLAYAYGISAAALCWVAYRVVRGWRIATTGDGLSPRVPDEGPDA